MTTYRLVVYDSPQHGFEQVDAILRRALGVPPGHIHDLTWRIHHYGRVRVPFPDFGSATEAFERILAPGPEGSSAGSLAVALEAVDEQEVRVVRRVRRTGEGDCPLDREQLEAFMGRSLDQYPPDPSDLPLLTVAGARAPIVLVVAGAPLVLAGMFTVMTWHPTLRPAGVSLAGGFLVAIALTGLVVVLLVRIWLPRANDVWLCEDHVTSRGLETHVAVPWARIRAFRDRSLDQVELLRQEDRVAAPSLAIPTPTEEVRTAVLAFLTRKGIPRED